jgi:hypothetical protein
MGTGVANIRLPSVDDPVALRKALLEAMDIVTDQAPPARRMSPCPMALSSSVRNREGDLR